ncbi:hypothetical protein TELCIR_13535, partial [Teladorsagia circumcincta]
MDERLDTSTSASRVDMPATTSRSHDTSTRSDDSILLSAISKLQGTSHAEPSCQVGYRTLFHPKINDPSNAAPPRRPFRIRTSQELIAEYAKGNFDVADVSHAMDDLSQDQRLPPSERLSLQIAQSLTIAANFDHTFSIEQLATRDLVMLIRTTGNQKNVSFSYMITTSFYNVQTHRNTLTELIIPHVLNPIKDNRRFVDILHSYTVTIPDIKPLCTTASATTATAVLNMKKINQALARLRKTPSALPPSVDAMEVEDIPISTRTTATSPIQSSSALCTKQTSSVLSLTTTQSSTYVSSSAARPQERLIPISPATSTRAPSAGTRRSDRTTRRRRSRSPSTPRHSRRRTTRSPARRRARSPSEHQSTSSFQCFFCHSDTHYSSDCTVVRSLTKRAMDAVAEGRCLYCLYVHAPGYCRETSTVECAALTIIIQHPVPTVAISIGTSFRT